MYVVFWIKNTFDNAVDNAVDFILHWKKEHDVSEKNAVLTIKKYACPADLNFDITVVVGVCFFCKYCKFVPCLVSWPSKTTTRPRWSFRPSSFYYIIISHATVIGYIFVLGKWSEWVNECISPR